MFTINRLFSSWCTSVYYENAVVCFNLYLYIPQGINSNNLKTRFRQIQALFFIINLISPFSPQYLSVSCWRLGDFFIYHQFEHSKFVLYPRRMRLCVLCEYQNKQRLFHSAALTYWFVRSRLNAFTARYELNLQFILGYFLSFNAPFSPLTKIT